MYRQTSSRANFSLVLGQPTLTFRVVPLDAEQAPPGYLKSLKVSIINDVDQQNASFMIYSSSDVNSVVGDCITAGAVPNGGGTVWMNLKRSIRSSAEEEDRSDGPVYVHIKTQNTSRTTVDVVCEAWGRFIELQPV